MNGPSSCTPTLFGRSSRTLAAALVGCGFALSAFALPDLQQARTISGVKIFRDHEDHRVFYYLKAEKRLATQGEEPDFRFDVNRYIGNTATEDLDTFWVRGVLKFRVTSDFFDTSYDELAAQLAAEIGGNIELRAAPVASSHNKLVYETVTPVEEGQDRGEITGGVVSTADDESTTRQRLGSQEQRFTIGLDSIDANFFWENFERDNLILSLAYGWEVKGVKPTADGGWEDGTYTVANSLPVEVSPSTHPSLFKKNELWQRVKVAHSSVTVMCYDFINAGESDLYHVIVDLRFTTISDKTYREQVKFVAGSSEYERLVRFQLANDLEEGYQYRVRRLFEDGTTSDLGWQESDRPYLDVSMTLDELAQRTLTEDEEI